MSNYPEEFVYGVHCQCIKVAWSLYYDIWSALTVSMQEERQVYTVSETAVERRVDRLERVVEQTSRSVNQLSYEMRAFKDEMRTFKDEMNKRWGDLANSLGTLVEDIVAPAFPDVMKRRFGMQIDDMMVRRKRRKGELREEFNLIAVVEERVFVVEVKSRYNSEYVDRFSQKLDRFKELFSEYEDKQIVGVVASLYVDESVIRYATKKGYYAMGMKGEYMDLLNAEEIERKSTVS